MKDFHAYYQFEYTFIPELMERYVYEGRELTILTDKLSWQGILTRLFTDSGFDWYNLKIQTYGNEDDPVIVVLYTFPEPFRVPLARYGAVVIKGDKPDYYTLESSFDGGYMLCSQNSHGLHLNFGTVPALSSDEFLEKVCAMEEITLPAPQSIRPKETLREKLKKIL